MIFNRLPKELKIEGVTLELLNSINLKAVPSPAQFSPGDEPARLLACSKGFWVVDPDGDFLRDRHGKLIVFDERTCQIARARYVLNFGVQEKPISKKGRRKKQIS